MQTEALQHINFLLTGTGWSTKAGWMAGAGKRVIAYIPEMVEPELMYKLFDRVVGSIDNLIESLR